MLIVLGVVLLVLAVLGVASLLDADRDTDGRSTPETTSAPAGNGEDDVNEDGSSEAPGNPPTGIPTQGKFVQVDESVYLDRTADFAEESLTRSGLTVTVENQFGAIPNDLGQCFVVKVTPDGRLQVGTEVLVRCEEE